MFKMRILNPPSGARTYSAIIGPVVSPHLDILEPWQSFDDPGSNQHFNISVFDAGGTLIGKASAIATPLGDWWVDLRNMQPKSANSMTLEEYLRVK